MKQVLFYLLIGSLFISACNNTSPKPNTKNKTVSVILPYKVDIETTVNNVKTVPLSTIGKEIEYIPLETNTKSLIKRIVKIEFSKNYIFISDFDRLTQFDRKGKFIRQVGANGRGPGEYIYVMEFCIDENLERIVIKDYGNSLIKVFDFEGQYIKSFKLPFESTNFLVKDTNSILFHLANIADKTKDSNYSLSLTDFYGTPDIKIRKYPVRKNSLNIGKMPLYYFIDSIRFMEFGVDTLYTLKNNKLEPYVIFNLGNVKMDPDPNIPIRNPERNVMLDQLIKKLWICDILENKEYVFIKLKCGLSDSSKISVFNKHTLETSFLDRNGFINDLDKGITFWPRYIYHDSILVDYQDAYKFLEIIKSNNQIVGYEGILSKGLTETSNPVVIVVK